jgi:hypothetical protein
MDQFIGTFLEDLNSQDHHLTRLLMGLVIFLNGQLQIHNEVFYLQVWYLSNQNKWFNFAYPRIKEKGYWYWINKIFIWKRYNYK